MLQTVGRNRVRTRWIILKPVRVVRRAEVQERVHVDLVIEHSNPTADHQVFPICGLVGETEARSEVVLVRRKDAADTVTLNPDASRRGKKHSSKYKKKRRGATPPPTQTKKISLFFFFFFFPPPPPPAPPPD